MTPSNDNGPSPLAPFRYIANPAEWAACLRDLRARFLSNPGAEFVADACRKDPPTIDFVTPG